MSASFLFTFYQLFPAGLIFVTATGSLPSKSKALMQSQALRVSVPCLSQPAHAFSVSSV
jgi:hypothetical protein